MNFKLNNFWRFSLPCLLSGIFLWLAFPSFPWMRFEFLGWFCLVPILLALRETPTFRAFLGKAILMNTICFALFSYSILYVIAIGYFLIIIYFAFVFTVPFVGLYLARKYLSWRGALWSFPFLWTTWEWLFHISDISLGAIRLGNTQANAVWLVQFIDITGVWGITFWLVLINVVIVVIIEEIAALRSLQKPILAEKFLIFNFAFLIVLFALPLAYSAYIFSREKQMISSEINVLLVQPNVSPWEKVDEDSQDDLLGKSIRLTDEALKTQKPDLIIWCETAYTYTWGKFEDSDDQLRELVKKWKTPLLTGTFAARTYAPNELKPSRLDILQTDTEYFNSAILLKPITESNGEIKVYDSPLQKKRRVVPFAEQAPYAEYAPWLADLNTQIALQVGERPNLSVGKEAKVFRFRTSNDEEIGVGAAICFEELFPTEFTDFVQNGATMLALITNEGWYDKSDAQYKLAAFSRLRSIETRRSVARTGSTGLTWICDPFGRITAQIPWWQEQTLNGKVPISKVMSLYVQYPDYFPKACGIALTLLTLFGFVRKFLR